MTSYAVVWSLLMILLPVVCVLECGHAVVKPRNVKIHLKVGGIMVWMDSIFLFLAFTLFVLVAIVLELV
jgi:hypothetical protein